MILQLFRRGFRTFVVVSQSAAEGDVGESGGEAGFCIFEADAFAVEDEF